MTEYFSVSHYPVFEAGIFQKHPELFDIYLHGAPPHLRKQYEERQLALRKYEGELTWPAVVGRGFCGATHQGAGNIFNSTLVGSHSLLYNSDSLYVNPALNIFAVADSPGVTTFSRRLFEKLDLYLATHPADDLEAVINDLNKNAGRGDSATLTLVYLPKDRRRAVLFIAGDTYLFQGNIFQKTIKRLEGVPQLLGTVYARILPQYLDLVPGDFFVIVSDGIFAIRANNGEAKLEELLLHHAVNGLEDFATNVIKHCNMVATERLGDRVITSFVSSDNVSALLVYPEQLMNLNGEQKSLILGGYVGEAQER